MRGELALTRESYDLARQRGVDPHMLAEVRAHCWMDGNRVVVDEKWLVAQVARAFAMGALEEPSGFLESALSAVNIPGNIARIAAGREHRARVVDRMDALDRDLDVLRNCACEDDLGELEVQLALTQLLTQYRDDVGVLWSAYATRHKNPLSRHAPWPAF